MSPERSAYDPLFAREENPEVAADAARAKAAFERASRAYLAAPLPWLVWALILPAAALATPTALCAGAKPGVLLVWSVAILAGGAVEGLALVGARRRAGGGPLGAWAMRVQGNLSLVALALSAALVWADAPELLPGLWLLLLGHSFFALGGLALPALRSGGNRLPGRRRRRAWCRAARASPASRSRPRSATSGWLRESSRRRRRDQAAGSGSS